MRFVPFAGDEEDVETFVRLQSEGDAGHSGDLPFATFHEVRVHHAFALAQTARVITSLPRAIHLTT